MGYGSQMARYLSARNLVVSSLSEYGSLYCILGVRNYVSPGYQCFLGVLVRRSTSFSSKSFA